MTTAINAANQTMIEALRAAGGLIVDDHGPGKDTRTVKAVIVYTDYDSDGKLWKQEVCPANAAWDYFSLNPLYHGEDGKIHLSVMACGPTVAPFKHNHSLEEAVAAMCAKKSLVGRQEYELVHL